MADTEGALEHVSKVGTSLGPREGALGIRSLAILEGRRRNRMRGKKSMNLRPTVRLGSMVVTTMEIDVESRVVMHRRKNPRYTTRYAVPSGICHVRG